MIKKLISTIKILYCLGMARTFGEYLHSVGGTKYDPPGARYTWRGKDWLIPTGPIEEEQQ